MGENAQDFFGVQNGSAGRPAGPKCSDLFVDSVIFKDRTTGKFYQRYFDNGEEQVVEVTL